MTRPANAERFDPRSMLLRGAAILALALAVSGCVAGRPMTGREVANDVPYDYRKRHPIAIKEGDRTVELFIGPKRGSLTAAQRTDIALLAGVWKRESSGGIVIEVPAGTPNEVAGQEAGREARSILEAMGVPGHAIAIAPYRPSDPVKLATVRINYPRMEAKAGPCGLWPHDLGPTYDPEHFENRQYWNLGCAHQRALASMVENPADLVQPRSESPIYAARRSTVLEKFKKGENTATVYQDPNKGKVSDVGQ